MRNAPIAVLFALFLLPALSCTREDGRASPTSAPPSAKQQPSSARADAKPPANPNMSAEEAAAALPGFPLEGVPAHQRGTLVSMAEDEFVFDGSPYTLAGCLKGDYGCEASAKRGLQLLLTLLNAGASRSDALTAYNRHYSSFDRSKRHEIDISQAACKGPANAPLTIVEFSDFQCPHCAAAWPVLSQVVTSRTDARLCFMHFPLAGNPHSSSAAQATVLAQRHGKFWELHDRIFQNQQRLSTAMIRDLAQQVGLDPEELTQGVQSGELAAVVDKQKAEGERIGIMGTPAIFVNGRKLELPLTPGFLQFSLDDELHWMNNGGGWAAR